MIFFSVACLELEWSFGSCSGLCLVKQSRRRCLC